MYKLANKYTLVSMKLKKPSPVKIRPDLVDPIVEAKGMTGSSKTDAKVTLNLYKNDYFIEVQRIHSMLNKEHKMMSLVWGEGHGGYRLMPNAQLERWKKLSLEYKMMAEAAWTMFINDYEAHVGRQRASQGDAFREEDYPTREQLEPRHGISFDYAMVPDPERDVRAGMTAEMQQEMRVTLIEQEAVKLKSAQDEIVGRLTVGLEKIIDRTSAYDGGKTGSYKDTMISNMQDIARIMKDFNMTDDPEFERARQDLLRNVCEIDPQVARDDEVVRSKLGQSAAAILERTAMFGQHDDA